MQLRARSAQLGPDFRRGSERMEPSMTTNATTSPYPDVPLPAGAKADPDGWEFWDNEFRTFHGQDRIIGTGVPPRRVAEVRTDGVQLLPDGRVDTKKSPPGINVYVYEDDLNSIEARGLARVLLDAADEVDGWA